MSNALADILSFFRGHWLHVVMAIPGALVFTALHELAHCAAVWVQGGTVTHFVWLPSDMEWGHVEYLFPRGVPHSSIAIALSPYAAWVSCALIAGLLSLRRAQWPFWCASSVFVWLFIAPLADIANTALPYLLLDADNDFRYGFGRVRLSFAVVAGVCGITAVAYGYFLSRRLYRERAVGLVAYTILAATAAVAVATVSAVRLF